MVVCGVDEHGKRDVLAVEPMAEESFRMNPRMSSGDSLSDGILRGLVNLWSVYQRGVDISFITKGSRLMILA